MRAQYVDGFWHTVIICVIVFFPSFFNCMQVDVMKLKK